MNFIPCSSLVYDHREKAPRTVRWNLLSGRNVGSDPRSTRVCIPVLVSAPTTNGMLSTPNPWSWQFALVLLLLSLLAPLFPNNRVRYYACYICYCLYVSLIYLMLVPIFMLRPKNIANLTVAGKCCKHLTKFIGITWTVRNEHILAKQQAAVITSNHQSIFDILGMFNIWETMGLCMAIAKKELLYIPPFGPAAWLSGLVYIDRSNTKAAMQTIQMSSQIIHDQKAKLWLYPEGTRNKKGKTLKPFKIGAFKVAIDSHSPIIPVVFSPYYFIDGRNKAFDRGEVIISVLDEVSTEGLQPEDAKELMNNVYSVMSAEYEKLAQEVKMKYCVKTE